MRKKLAKTKEIRKILKRGEIQMMTDEWLRLNSILLVSRHDRFSDRVSYGHLPNFTVHYAIVKERNN